MEQIETFRQLGDETRLRALALMNDQGELCVCELVAGLGLSQPKISRHLAALRDAGLVEAERKAQWVFYRISRSLAGWQKQVIAAALEGVAGEPVLQQDKARLKQMNSRPARSTAA
jgi:ArsR family transcriptional regulator